MIFILELIFKGLIQWIFDMVISITDFLANSLLTVFSMDLSYFESKVPVTSSILSVLMYTGLALLLGNLFFQLMKSMASGLGFEGEDPKILLARTLVMALLLLGSRQVCDIGLSFTSNVITALQVPTELKIPKITESSFSMPGDASWLLALILGIMLVIQIIKLFFEVGERYVIVAVLTILSPLAFAMGGSRNTSDIFKGWVRTFGSMLLMMVLSVVFLKFILAAMTDVPTGVAIFPWMIFIIALARISRKIDSVVARIGLTPAFTGDPLSGSRIPGMLSTVIIRNMANSVSRTIGENKAKTGKESISSTSAKSSSVPSLTSASKSDTLVSPEKNIDRPKNDDLYPDMKLSTTKGSIPKESKPPKAPSDSSLGYSGMSGKLDSTTKKPTISYDGSPDRKTVTSTDNSKGVDRSSNPKMGSTDRSKSSIAETNKSGIKASAEKPVQPREADIGKTTKDKIRSDSGMRNGTEKVRNGRQAEPKTSDLKNNQTAQDTNKSARPPIGLAATTAGRQGRPFTPVDRRPTSNPQNTNNMDGTVAQQTGNITQNQTNPMNVTIQSKAMHPAIKSMSTVRPEQLKPLTNYRLKNDSSTVQQERRTGNNGSVFRPDPSTDVLKGIGTNSFNASEYSHTLPPSSSSNKQEGKQLSKDSKTRPSNEQKNTEPILRNNSNPKETHHNDPARIAVPQLKSTSTDTRAATKALEHTSAQNRTDNTSNSKKNEKATLRVLRGSNTATRPSRSQQPRENQMNSNNTPNGELTREKKDSIPSVTHGPNKPAYKASSKISSERPEMGDDKK